MNSPWPPSSPPEETVDPLRPIQSSAGVPTKRLSYADLPEVVQPDTSPEVASPHQSAYAARLEAFSEKYTGEKPLFKEQEKYPEVVKTVDRSSSYELSAVKYDYPSHAREQGIISPVRTICGVERRRFRTTVAIFFIVLAAVAVGIGVGVGVKHSSSSSNSEVDSVSDGLANKDVSTSTISQSPPTATPPSTDVFLNNMTDIGNGFAFQGFSQEAYLGEFSPLVRKEGKTKLGFDVRSYVWKPGKTKCCVTLCLNDTLRAGWTCDEALNRQASEEFRFVWVWCNQMRDIAGTNAVCNAGDENTNHT